MMARRTIDEISVEDVEKRRQPSKHYEYVIRIRWSDQNENIVYRRYSKFFEFQNRLLERFPVEGGLRDPNERILPFLPGKILFGRSHIREVAKRRQGLINEYCKELIKLPNHICQCVDVLDFFEPWPEDLEALTKRNQGSLELKGSAISGPQLTESYVAVGDFRAEGRNEVSVEAGQRVEVVDKMETGWWFVSTDLGQGWVPSAYLEAESGNEESRVLKATRPGEGERYLCHRTYVAQEVDEVSMEKGCIVEVLERNLDGWWLCRVKGNQGRAPATNLVKADTLKAQRYLGGSGAAPLSAPQAPGLRMSAPHKEMSPLAGKRQWPPPRRDSIVRPMTQPQPPKVQKAAVLPPPRPAPPKLSTQYMTTQAFRTSVPNGLSFDKGKSIKLIEKNPGGWWYVQIEGEEGWVPADYVQEKHSIKKSPTPARPPPPSKVKPEVKGQNQGQPESKKFMADLNRRIGQQNSSGGLSSSGTSSQSSLDRSSGSDGEFHSYDNVTKVLQVSRSQFKVICDYVGEEEGEMSLVAGDEVEVIERSDQGWWCVTRGQHQGWVPSSYLQPITKATPGNSNHSNSVQPGNSSHGNNVSVSNGAMHNQGMSKPKTEDKKTALKPNPKPGITIKPNLASKPSIPSKPQVPGQKPTVSAKKPTVGSKPATSSSSAGANSRQADAPVDSSKRTNKIANMAKMFEN